LAKTRTVPKRPASQPVKGTQIASATAYDVTTHVPCVLVRPSQLIRDAGVFPYWPRSMRWPPHATQSNFAHAHCQDRLSLIRPPKIGPKIGPTTVVMAHRPIACACFIFPQEKHAQAMGLWAMTTVVGPILGPILGGLISLRENAHEQSLTEWHEGATA
jgi:hypothetical protein